MQKALLMSLILGTIIIPIRYASDPSPARGARRMIVAMFGLVFAYVLALLFIYPRLT